MHLTGYHHVSLSVTDLDASAHWYEQVLPLTLLFEEDADGARRARVYRVEGTGTMLGLVQHTAGDGTRFRPERTGLDHVAFGVADRAALILAVERLDDLGVAHSGIIDIPLGAICNLPDPDGIALSLFWES